MVNLVLFILLITYLHTTSPLSSFRSNSAELFAFCGLQELKITMGNGINHTMGNDASEYKNLPSGASVSSPLSTLSANIAEVDAIGIVRSFQTQLSTISIISTAAGTGITKFNGDGGQATSAQISNSYGVAVDASGNIYIADSYDHRIRMVTKSTGIISTIVGSGVSGYSGDGGQATSAQLSNPYGIALDASGNIYIADSFNNCIRMVTKTTGIIRTVAGTGVSGYSGDEGQATSAQLSNPYDISLDASGNIFIADSSNNCIRMVTKSTGIISTVAGTGKFGNIGDGGQATSAQLSNPSGVAVDASGNIYIADTYDHRIRVVTRGTGVISTVPGTGYHGYGISKISLQGASTQYNGLHGVAVDASGDIYIADTYDHRIRVVKKSNGIIKTVVGTGESGYSGDGGQATSARLYGPHGIAIDATGNIYIADTYDNRIRMVTKSDSVINTVAGTGVDVYSGDRGQATSAKLSTPRGIAIDLSGNIYVADSYDHRIRMVTMSTGVITTAAGTGVSGYSGDGGQATSAQLSNSTDIAVDALGNIYIADSSNNCIRIVSVNAGIIKTVAGNGVSGYSGDGGQATSAQLSNPYGITLDVSNNIYIADSSNNCIRMVTKSTGIIRTVAGTGVSGYSGDGGQATSAQLSKPYCIALDASGNIFIADSSNNCIRMVTKSTGIISTITGTGVSGYSGDGGQATSARLYGPRGVFLDFSGNIYIADTYDHRIRMVTRSSGVIRTVVGAGVPGYSGDGGQSTSAQLNGPHGITLDAFGNIYIADSSNNCIRKVAQYDMPSIWTVSVLRTTQSISGLSSAQATVSLFRTALIDTVALVLKIPSDTILLWKIALFRNGPVEPNSIRVVYSTSVRSGMNSTFIASLLNDALLDRSFALALSNYSGISSLNVRGNFSATATFTGAAVAEALAERTSARSFPIFGVIFGGIAVAAFILFSVFYLRNLRSSSTSRRSEPVTTVDANIDLEGVQVETVQRGLGEEELAREGSTEAERLGEDRGNSLFEQEKALLEALEKSRIANVARIGAFGSERRRFLEAEKVRLAELGKRRLLEAERQRLPEAERLRLMEEDRLKLTDEIKLKLSDSELTKLATAERARLVNEMAVSRLRLQVEAVNRQLVTESEDAPPHPLIDYIPEERLVSMNTSAGVCLILADGAEILHRVSLDCQHAIGAAAVSQYLERSEKCGPFPLRCPLCLADGPTAGIITESPLRALVAAGVISEDLCVSILNKHIRLNRDQASLEVLYTTSKACPFCSIRIIHYRGHSCHHITPGDGCPSCHNHFCYSCLGYTGDGAAWQGCPNGCRSACDETCSCPDCPDCRRGTPCVFCSYPSYTECRVCSSV